MHTPSSLSGLARKRGHIRQINVTQRDKVRRAAGATYDAMPFSGKKMADALGVHHTAVTHRKQGRRSTALSRFCEEAYKLERAGISAAYLIATVQAVAMWPELERLSTSELESLLKQTLRDETRANSRCNDLDAEVLAGEPVDPEVLRAEHLRQAAKSERVVAIMDILMERTR